MASKRSHQNVPENPSWEIDIQNNLSELSESITNFPAICIKLIEKRIISYDEMETIQKESTGSIIIFKLLYALKSRDWSQVRPIFLQILRDTYNDRCVNIIKSASDNQPSTSPKRANPGNENSSNKTNLPKPLKSKWWPEEKLLPNSFYERKNETDELFTEKLKKLLTQNEIRTTVINQKVAVSGLGGIGKSTTAKWFGQQYKEDYDFILWIDCGEGSLLKSFTSLARILKVEERKELELKELAAGCFQILEDNKCLFIYDNAECYVGADGIRDVLPKSLSKFHVIITSRNREWGNKSGHGQIPDFQLDVFDKNEAMEFVRRNLEINSKNEESKLESLCELLGNLPLALQIAVATLNQHKMSLIDYIENVKNSEHIIVTPFDDYERTINKTMQISLDIIRNHERNVGGLAYRILNYFGYITPDDVDLNFFLSVENQNNRSEMYEATQLLESYSLITNKILQRDLPSNNISNQYLCSIHRLLQQVIRHNSAESKNEILKQILNCEGFLEYKLIPFSYAGEELQNEFPQLKAELIDRLELQKLLKERKFHEAVELSRLIKDALNNLTSRFNYGVCLKYNSEEKKSIEVFESLFYETKKIIIVNEWYHEEYFNQFGIIWNRNKELTMEVILGQILINDAKYKEAAHKLFLILKRVIFPITTPLNEIVTFVNSQSFPNYTLRYEDEEDYISFSIGNEDHAKKFELPSRVVDKNFQLPKDLQELTLKEAKFMVQEDTIVWNLKKLNLIETNFLKNIPLITVQELTIENSKVDIYLLPQSLQKLKLYACILVNNPATVAKATISPLPHLQNLELTIRKVIDVEEQSSGEKLEQFDVSHLLSPSLIKLQIVDGYYYYYDNYEDDDYDNSDNDDNDANDGFYYDDTGPEGFTLYVPLNRLKLIKDLDLGGCNLIVPRDVIPIAPQELALRNVHIRDEENNDHSSMLVNNFINFSNMESLYLKNMSIDLSEDVTINQMWLRAMKKVVNWENAKWKINKLNLIGYPDLSRTEIRVKEITIWNSLVDVSHLPQTLEKLIVWEHTSIICPTSSDGSNVTRCWPSSLQQLKIKPKVAFLDAHGVKLKEFNISATFPYSLNKLTIECRSSTRLLVGLNCLPSIDVLRLRNCDLMYFPTIPAMRIAPKDLRLWDVNIIDGHANTKVDIPLNYMIDFKKMQKLQISEQIIDFSEPCKLEVAELWDTKLINWENGKWTIEKLSIAPNLGPTTNIIQQLHSNAPIGLHFVLDSD